MAKFQKGHKLATGRPKDSLSKRSLRFADAIMDSGVDLVAELIGALNNAKEIYKKAEEKQDTIGMLSANAQITNNAEKMLPYLYPKLSAIEVKPTNPIATMSHEDKLKAIERAREVVELEMKASDDTK